MKSEISPAAATKETFEKVDSVSHDFWVNNNDLFIRGFGDRSGAQLTDKPKLISAGRLPTFLIDTPKDGFRLPTHIKTEELIDDGDVKVRLYVAGFRPSQTDRESFAKQKFG